MTLARIIQLATLGVALFAWRAIVQAESLRIGTFDVDASPPISSQLAYDPTKEVTTPLSCRGIVLLGDEAPVVLCAVDWIGIGNGGNREFRARLAAAAGTTPERVAVHTLHQHDAPWCDFSVDELAAQYGINQVVFDSAFARDVIHRAAAAVRSAVAEAQVVTHVGAGVGRVEQVASNRRILGADGKVQHVRWTATKDAAVRAFPEGVIDPDVHWNVEPVRLPPAQHLDEAALRGELENADKLPRARLEAAHGLVWLARCQQGDTIDVGCLSLGSISILHMPGELFVEYQLAAQAMRPDLFVAMAAYGDYAPWYIGTEIAYEQGGV